jgi:prepilin-type N-terminal cleavage/methylation domain-containing protein
MTSAVRNRGFSLLEILMVLALIAIAAAATLALLAPNRENARAISLARDVEALVENIRRTYATEENYAPPGGNLSTFMAVQRGLFPPHMVFNAFGARDPWARAVLVQSWPTTGAAQILNSQFAITLFRPGDDACVPLALALLRMDPAEFSQTLPSTLTIASPATRPTTAAIAGMAQAACAGNTAAGTGSWRVVFD